MIELGDGVEHAIIAMIVRPIVGLIEGDVQHARFDGLHVFERHLTGNVIVASFVPGREQVGLHTAELGNAGGHVAAFEGLEAGVDHEVTFGGFGDVAEMVPTGEERDLFFRQRELAAQEFEHGLGGIADGVVTLDDVVLGATGEDFRVAGIGDAIAVGDLYVRGRDAERGEFLPKERHQSLAALELAGAPVALVTGVLVGHVRRFLLGQERVQATKGVLPAEAVGGDQNDVLRGGLGC